MKEWVEFEGKTVSAAVANACERLELTEDQLTYEVISHGSSGIFGLVGVRNARIRVLRPKRVESTASELQAAAATAGSAGVQLTSADGSPAQEEHAAGACAGDAMERGRELVERIAKALISDASVSVVCEEGRLRYEICGEDQGVLIGKQGQTLEAIHYLVEKIVNKNSDKRIRVYVDVGGYLEKRRQDLKDLAARMAKKARKSGKPATVGQMNAHDRRIIHLELKDDPAVRTQSVGQGPIRNLIIFPKKPHPKSREKSRRNRPKDIGAE